MIRQQNISQPSPCWLGTAPVAVTDTYTVSLSPIITSASLPSRLDAMYLLADRIMSEDSELLRELAKR